MIILAVVVAIVLSVAISYFIMVEAVKRCIDFTGSGLIKQNDCAPTGHQRFDRENPCQFAL